MPIFEIQGPDGKTYELDAPDQNAALSAIGQVGGKQKTDNGMVDAALLGAGDGAGFGFADEGAALMATAYDRLWSGKGLSYDDYLKRARGVQQQAQENNPGSYLGGQVGGAVGVGLGAGGAGLNLAGRGSGLVARGLGYAGEGAIYGGLQGAGGSEDGSRLAGAALGVRNGIAAGLAAPVATNLVGRAVRPVVDAVRNATGPASSQAVNRVVAAMRGTGMDDAAFQARIGQLGPDGMLVDAMGDRGQALARATANVSPDARQALEAASNARMAAQPERFVSVLEQAAGLPQGNRLTAEGLKEQAYDRAAPAINQAYGDARALGAELPLEDFRDIIASPMGGRAFREAERSVDNRIAAGNLEADSDLGFLDAAKRRLDATARVAARQGDNDKADQARALARALREQTDAALDDPIYEEARNLRSAAYRADEAYDLGAELAGPRLPLDAANRARGGAGVQGPVRPEVARGYAAELAEAILNRRGTPGALDRLNTPLQQEAMDAALQGGAQQVRDQLGRERVFGGTHRALTGNSTTARQLKEMGVTIGAGAGVGYLGGLDPTQAGMAGVATALLRKGGGAAVRAIRSGNEERVAQHIAELLMARGVPASPEGVAIAIQNPERARAIAQVVAAAAGGQAGAMQVR